MTVDKIEKLVSSAKSIVDAPWQAQLGKQDLIVLIVSGFQLHQLKKAIEDYEESKK